MVWGDLVRGDFGWRGFCPGGILAGGILSRGDFGWGDFVQGDFVRGDFVRGDFVLEPVTTPHQWISYLTESWFIHLAYYILQEHQI